MNTNSFGVWLKVKLAERNLKQKELAKAMGISEASVSKWIKGDRNPRGVTMSRIMAYLGETMPIDGRPVFTITAEPRNGVTLGQLLYYMTEGDIIQICDDRNCWDAYTEFNATSKLLEPFICRRIVCMGAEKAKDGCAIRVDLAEEGK